MLVQWSSTERCYPAAKKGVEKLFWGDECDNFFSITWIVYNLYFPLELILKCFIGARNFDLKFLSTQQYVDMPSDFDGVS